MSHYKDDDLSSLFSADGMIHVIHEELPSSPNKQKKMHRDTTYDDAEVCLTCTRKTCYGESDCFARRKKKLKRQKKKK